MTIEGKRAFLVAYDQGKIGALWGVILARSEHELRDIYPELAIVESRPAWMTDNDYQRLTQTSFYDIDQKPWGLLEIIVNERT